jgi:RimJ/RimL family protein N-acetyltransferase
MDAPEVVLRDVVADDVPVLFEHQRDPEAAAMAAFRSRDREAHSAHWEKILADEAVVAKAIVADGVLVGSVVTWPNGPDREVGYWIDRAHWGRGIATAALSGFLELVTQRPLTAYVAAHNKGSIRVLEKCGFVPAGEPVTGEDGVEGIPMELPA